MIPLPPAPDRFAVLAVEVIGVLLLILLLWRIFLATVRSTWKFSDERRERRARTAEDSNSRP
jgi:uncharacterized protein HemY